jgi:hypothetical protein
MRGGFIIAVDEGLFERSARALTELGGTQATDSDGDGVVQFADADGRMFTLFERVPAGTEWEVREGPFVPAPGAIPPDMGQVIACPFECRWPDLTATLADTIAQTAEAPTWVLDGDGVIWDAEAVDSDKVRL